MNSSIPPNYPLPQNEDARLAEIFGYDFTDEGPNDNLDAICRLAQSLFGVPMALITLVDRDEQMFLANCGVDADGTPRRDAFCTYTILNDEVFVVSDVTQDLRFAANPLVTGDMHVRFYAGAPLILRPGVRMGSLCLLDTRSREFSAKESAQLQNLATIAVNELRRRRTMIDLRREQDLLAQAARMAKIGTWVLDVRGDTLSWSPETYRIFGLSSDTAPTVAFARTCVTDASRAVIEPAVNALITSGNTFDLEVDIVTAQGTPRRVRCIAEVEVANDGRAVRFTGSVQETGVAGKVQTE
jgi:PAS domain-containing protein